MKSDVEPNYHGGNLLDMPMYQFNEMMAWILQQALRKDQINDL